MDWGIRAPARWLATRNSVRACLALREKAVVEEGDAFLVRMPMREAVHPMGGGPERTWFFGMPRPYGEAASR
jgi:hypothetical protein